MKPDILSLETVLAEPVAFAFEIPFSAPELEREPLLEISPVRFEGQVERIEGGFSLQGRLVYSGRLECSRCLVSYPFDEDQPFSLVLYPRPALAPLERELEKADLDAYFYDEPAVAVAPIVEERIQLAVPMKPLCRPECRGLCPQCGVDRNREACNCVTDAVDPRWEAAASSDGLGRQKVRVIS